LRKLEYSKDKLEGSRNTGKEEEEDSVEQPRKRTKLLHDEDIVNNQEMNHKSKDTLSNNNIKQDELVRLIIQALGELGYNDASSTLEKESGILLQSPAVSEFCKGVLGGDWELVNKRVSDLHIADKEDFLNAKFLVYQQKFLELLEARKIKEALDCLRNELTPLNRDPQKLHKLSSYIMCTSAEDLQEKAMWDGLKGKSRSLLLKDLRAFISPEILPPESRLQKLLLQSIQFQHINCLYHNTFDNNFSLLNDHSCTSEQLPTVTKLILEKHTDEVWYIRFSHDGKYLASASKDATIVLWNVLDPTMKVFKVLTGHIAAISFVAWSPDNKMLLSCGNDNLVKLWDVQSGACIKTFSKHAEPVTAVAWLPDGKSFITGSIDKQIYMMDLEGNEIRSWTCARVNDLAVTHDGKRMVVICQEKKLRIYDLESNKAEESIQESDSPTSLELSGDSKQILVNISAHEIHAWDIATKRLTQKYRGQKQSRFVIRSCFGGANQAFVLSGSEDSQVYIWHRSNGQLLKALQGHSGTVNTVCWNPADPSMFASCSDDHTIRIWTAR